MCIYIYVYPPVIKHSLLENPKFSSIACRKEAPTTETQHIILTGKVVDTLILGFY